MKAKLVEIGVMTVDPEACPPVSTTMPIQTHGLNFEQQKELLLLQLQFDERKHELEVKMQIEVEVIRQQTEKIKLDLEVRRLSVGKYSEGSGEDQGRQVRPCDINNLQLVPQFREMDVFFALFECVAKARSWSDADCALMLQCVLTGKAQEAYSSLSAEDSAS